MKVQISAKDVATYASTAGASLWVHPGGGIVVAVERPHGTVLGLPHDPVWIAQWDGDWDAAAEQLNMLAVTEGTA